MCKDYHLVPLLVTLLLGLLLLYSLDTYSSALSLSLFYPTANGTAGLSMPPVEALPLDRLFISTVTSVRYSSDVWTHWLAHYTDASLGLDRVPKANFLVILNSPKAGSPQPLASHAQNGTELDKAVALFEAHGITPVVWQETYTTYTKETFKNDLYAARVPHTAWLIEADDDELIEFPKPVPELLGEAEALGYNVIAGEMVDHIAADCRLPRARPTGSLWDQYPCVSTVTKDVLGAKTEKKPIHTGDLYTGGGQHKMVPLTPNGATGMERVSPVQLRLHHFKWREGCLEKLRERVERYKKLEMGWWVESENFLQFYDKHGKIAVPECGCT